MEWMWIVNKAENALETVNERKEMNLKQLLNISNVRNDIAKAVEKKAKNTTPEQELKDREEAMAMTKVLLNEALRARKAAEEKAPPFPKKTIITGDD